MRGLLEQKVIVVTGAAGGIGAASADCFAAQGAAVALTDLEAGHLEPVVRGLGQRGHETFARAADLCAEEQVAAFFDSVHERFGRIDGLMCCAGVGYPQKVLETDGEAFLKIMAVNVQSSYLCCRHAYRLMKVHQAGAVVLVASRLAHAAYPDMVPYIASKGAVTSMTRAMAVDFAEAGVRVNAVLPGATETPMMKREIAQSENPAATRNRLERQTVLGGVAQPLDIAWAAGFLMSDAARFITGTELVVDGGCLARVFEGAAN